ncbi:MAG TPA: ribonuclease H-like domain-containing protein [Nitrospiria bacterium]|nr:ribonuclease H-like domain-containing protein [Nitrospiria bacterium]
MSLTRPPHPGEAGRARVNTTPPLPPAMTTHDGDRLVIDLETQHTFEEVGGRDRLEALKVSVLGLYSYAADRFQIYRESDLKDLELVLGRASLIIGFNLRRFDYPVLSPYLPLPFERLPTLDLLEEVTNALGHRVSLDSLADATLGAKKSGHGLDAIKYYRAGEFERLSDYCLTDVRLTRDLYEFGAQHGELYYSKAGQRQRVPVSWGTLL